MLDQNNNNDLDAGVEIDAATERALAGLQGEVRKAIPIGLERITRIKQDYDSHIFKPSGLEIVRLQRYDGGEDIRHNKKPGFEDVVFLQDVFTRIGYVDPDVIAPQKGFMNGTITLSGVEQLQKDIAAHGGKIRVERADITDMKDPNRVQIGNEVWSAARAVEEFGGREKAFASPESAKSVVARYEQIKAENKATLKHNLEKAMSAKETATEGGISAVNLENILNRKKEIA